MTEAQHAINFLVRIGPHANTTLRNRDADEVMMQTGGNILARGVLYDIVCKRASPGVQRLTLKRSN